MFIPRRVDYIRQQVIMLLILRRFLGEAIKRRREELGLSQKELACRAGVQVIYISRFEQGSRNVNLFALDAISEVLGCKPSVLFGEAELRAYRAAGEHGDAPEITTQAARIPRKFKTPLAKYL